MRNSVFGIVVSGILFLSFSVVCARSITLDELQLSIEESGANWKAGQTSYWTISDEKAALLFEPISEADAEATLQISPEYAQKSTRGIFDWRDVGGVDWTTSIKDQGDTCSASGIFAILAAQEVHINFGLHDAFADWDMSEQFVISCGFNCTPPSFPVLLEYMQNTGTVREDCFPYAGTYNPPFCYERCMFWNYQLYNLAYYQFMPIDVNATKAELEIAPLIARMIFYEDFLAYTGGVYQHIDGNLLGVHYVTLVGYNDEAEEPYWIGKNSFGTDWGEMGPGNHGERGWFRIRLGVNECGIETYVTLIRQYVPDYSIPATNIIGALVLIIGFTGLLIFSVFLKHV